MKRTVIEQEKDTVSCMISLYCKKNHGTEVLCSDCLALLEYAHIRLDKCPYKENKPTCRKCTIHCYSPEKKKQIQGVMRFSGPKMIVTHPIKAIKHLIRKLRLNINLHHFLILRQYLLKLVKN